MTKINIEKFNAKAAKEQDWKDWKSDFETFLETKRKKIKTEDDKFTWLLYLGGKELRDVYENATKLKSENPPFAYKPYTNAIARLDAHYGGSTNLNVRIGRFRATKQNENETFDQFLVKLREHASKCDFGEQEDREILYQISQGARLSKVRDKAFESDMEMAKIIDYAHIQEIVSGRKEEESKDKEIRFVNERKRIQDDKKCSRCGIGRHLANDNRCIARTQQCRKCNMYGHFARMCRKSQASTKQFSYRTNRIRGRSYIDERQSNAENNPNQYNKVSNSRINQINEHSDEEYVYEKHALDTMIMTINDVIKKGIEIITCTIADTSVQFLIDSGSPINTVTYEIWNMIKGNKEIWNIKTKCNREFQSYGSQKPLKVIANFQTILRIPHITECVAEFFVIENASQSLICKTTGEQLNVLRIGLDARDNIISAIDNVFPTIPIAPIHIHIDKAIPPSKVLYCRIPVALKEKVKDKLTEMLRVNIVERVHEPTSWISPMIAIPKKDNDIRICVDMRHVNQAIRRINHPMPTMDCFRVSLKGFTIFSKLDITNAYHHLLLDEESKHLTTFMSPLGLLRYTRLMFGINCAPEIFQKVMDEIFSDCDGIVIYLDDILVGGTDRRDHDTRLQKVMKKINLFNLELNKSKCEYHKERIEFMGFIISKEGVEISPKKVEVIKQFRKPASVDEVRSFMGLVTFIGHFIDDLATKTEPLREMLKKDKFEWTSNQDRAFENLKNEIIKCTLKLGFFDPLSQTYLYTDASGTGIGAILVQKDNAESRVITCIARSLTKIEQAYPQVQREALAIVWAVKKLYYYLFGLEFTIMTDNRALKFIFGNNTSLGKRACNRAESYALELQMYKYNIMHIPGKQNISDVLSRLVDDKHYTFKSSIPNESICNIMMEDYFALTPKEIKQASISDSEIQKTIKALQDEDWPTELSQYKTIKDNLYEWDQILWREDRVILPKSLRSTALEIAHRGHPGAVTMKRTLRERVWWPGMDKDVSEFIKACLGCTCVAKTDPPEPLSMTILPDTSWRNIAIDFFDAHEISVSLLVIVDYYSRYVMAKQVRNKTASEVIQILEDLFHLLDYPEIMRTDNGPPFTSKEFNEYCSKVGIKLDHSIPLWAQSNGEVERQNQGIKRALRIAKVEKRNWKTAVDEEIDAYNKRPHSVTGVAPAELLLKRQIKTLLPMKKGGYKCDTLYEEVRERDGIAKEKMKEYADRKRKAKSIIISEGETVLMKNNKIGKLQPNFDPIPFEVIERRGKKAIIKNKDGQVTERCVSELKKFDGEISTNFTDINSNLCRDKSKRTIKPNKKYLD